MLFAQPFTSAVYGSFPPATPWPGCANPVSVLRAEEDAEMLVSTAVQHRNISASLKQRGYYMGGSTEHFWAGKVSPGHM